MEHIRSPLGDIPGFGIIREFDDMMIRGEKLLERDRIQRERDAQVASERCHRLNRAFVRDAKTEHTVRLERQGTSDWYSAYANKDYAGRASGYLTSNSFLFNILPGTPSFKHMLMHLSTKPKEGFTKVKIKCEDNEESHGYEEYVQCMDPDPRWVGHQSGWLPVGQCRGLFKELFNLKNGKSKTIWVAIEKNTDIGEFL